MNPQDLAKAVVHWLEFERLCERKVILSEAALRQPVGQYLKASQKHIVVPENHYPLSATTRSKAIDFCLRRRTGRVIKHSLEVKWIGDNPRASLMREVLNDIYRLQYLKSIESLMKRVK